MGIRLKHLELIENFKKLLAPVSDSLEAKKANSEEVGIDLDNNQNSPRNNASVQNLTELQKLGPSGSPKASVSILVRGLVNQENSRNVVSSN